MDDFKQVHAVEAGVQTLVAFVIGNGMQHGIVHHAVVIAVQHFAEQEEILLLLSVKLRRRLTKFSSRQ